MLWKSTSETDGVQLQKIDKFETLILMNSVSEQDLAQLSEKDFEEFIYQEQQKVITQVLQGPDISWLDDILNNLPYNQEKS